MSVFNCTITFQENMSGTMDIISSCEVEKNLHRFVISGVQEQDELLSLRRKIEALDGRVEDLTRNIFTPVCTHVIAKEFNSTEKVLGALAGGMNVTLSGSKQVLK